MIPRLGDSSSTNEDAENQENYYQSATNDHLEVNGTLYRLDGRLATRAGKMIFSGQYTATDKNTQQRVAIKTQRNDDEMDDEDLPGRLSAEYQNYRQLCGVRGVPKLHDYATDTDYAILILDLMGPSLADLLAYIKQKTGTHKISLRTVCMLADQLLRILRRIHTRGLVHRDIKPQNIAIGLAEKQRQFYIFDFDLADRVQEPSCDYFAGTYAYASARAHQNLTACRADDLESLLYTLIFLANGTLPWFDALDEAEVARHKQRIATEDLCHGLPEVFAYYHRYIRSMSPTAEPYYKGLINRFNTCFIKERFHWGYDFEWTVEAQKEVEAAGSVSTDSSDD